MKNKPVFQYINLIFVCLFSGILCGVIGTLFTKSIAFVTIIRNQNSWLIFLLPIGGLLSVAVCKGFKVSGIGTNNVIASTADGKFVSPMLTPTIFLCSTISHLFGASVGREGAALQLGGGVASSVGRLFHLDAEEIKLLTYASMAGLFSAVFGTPLAAFAFVLEVVYVGHICLKAVIPSFTGSIAAYFTAVLLKNHAERFSLDAAPAFHFSVLWRVCLICAFSAALGMLFCKSIKLVSQASKQFFKTEYLRIFIGGLLIAALTLIIGTTDYNGAGISIIDKIFEEGHFDAWAFVLKILFTVIAVSAGYKGGEIVPTLFIGATFGALMGSLLGLTPAFGASIGMTALFCSVTNCPTAAFLLSFELFSGVGWYYAFVASFVCFLLSGRISLYSAQKVSGFKNTVAITTRRLLTAWITGLGVHY